MYQLKYSCDSLKISILATTNFQTFHSSKSIINNTYMYKYIFRCIIIVVTPFASHRCRLGLIPGPGVTCGLSLLLVLVLPTASVRVLQFSSLHKNQHSKFQFIQKQWTKSHHVDMPLLNPIYLFNYLFIYSNLSVIFYR